mgnify:FL=1
MTTSRAWQRQSELYRHFGRYLDGLDWSDGAAQAMYDYESRGVPMTDPWCNGYFVGKHWLDWQITAWREGLADGTLRRRELFGYPRALQRRCGLREDAWSG